jgi:hypothetical protein
LARLRLDAKRAATDPEFLAAMDYRGCLISLRSGASGYTFFMNTSRPAAAAIRDRPVQGGRVTCCRENAYPDAPARTLYQRTSEAWLYASCRLGAGTVAPITASFLSQAALLVTAFRDRCCGLRQSLWKRIEPTHAVCADVPLLRIVFGRRAGDGSPCEPPRAGARRRLRAGGHPLEHGRGEGLRPDSGACPGRIHFATAVAGPGLSFRLSALPRYRWQGRMRARVPSEHPRLHQSGMA